MVPDRPWWFGRWSSESEWLSPEVGAVETFSSLLASEGVSVGVILHTATIFARATLVCQNKHTSFANLAKRLVLDILAKLV